MKSMLIGSVLEPSLLQSPLRANVVASGHQRGGVSLSQVNIGKTIRLEQSSTKFGMLNPSQNANIYGADIRSRKSKFLANTASESLENEPVSGAVVHPHINGKSILTMLAAIYKYSRVYTIKGSVLSIISISLLAVQSLSDFTPLYFLGVFQATFGGCLANLYVTGINQLSDIETDKVNKPYLVLASGELPVRTGVLLTSLYAILGFGLGWCVNSWPLKLGLFLWYAVGTAYSINVPFLRWKKSPVLAAMTIWILQGVIVPIFFHLHAQTYIQGRKLLLSKHAMYVFAFMSIHSIVHALFKDVPDVEGDKINGINSFALQFGQRQIFWISVWLLEIIYGMAILIGLSSARFWTRLIMVIAHSIFGFILWTTANSVDLESNEAMESFYLFIWKLYYAEYLLVPILRF